MNLDACLPTDLRGPTTTITPIAAGLSGAGVYRVDAHGRSFVLKVAKAAVPDDEWHSRLRIQRTAADAGVAPAILHVDEAQRAVLSAFVVDHSFPARYGNPTTRSEALVQLGRTIRRVHDLPLAAEDRARDPREFAASTWSELDASLAVPAFVSQQVRRVLEETPPPTDRPVVLSHNDVNPTNLVFDGERLLLLDWDTAGRNDPFYDLASAAVFLRMDDETSRALLSAHDGAPVRSLPVRFAYMRRLVAVLAGAVFLRMAQRNGHRGAGGEETLDSVPSLGDFYRRIMSGTLNVASGEGQWWFGLALVKSAVES